MTSVWWNIIERNKGFSSRQVINATVAKFKLEPPPFFLLPQDFFNRWFAKKRECFDWNLLSPQPFFCFSCWYVVPLRSHRPVRHGGNSRSDFGPGGGLLGFGIWAKKIMGIVMSPNIDYIVDVCWGLRMSDLVFFWHLNDLQHWYFNKLLLISFGNEIIQCFSAGMYRFSFSVALLRMGSNWVPSPMGSPVLWSPTCIQLSSNVPPGPVHVG